MHFIYLTYIYMLLVRCFHLQFNLYPIPQVLVQKVLTFSQL